jgi:predicted nucleic acid-binding protein
MTSVAADTNIWLRYLTRDDPAQAERALRWLEMAEAVFVPTTVLLELAGVLRAAYRFERATIEAALRQIAGLPNVQLEQPDAVARALDDYSRGLDFADALHAASCPAGVTMFTLDRSFVEAGLAVGVTVAALP